MSSLFGYSNPIAPNSGTSSINSRIFDTSGAFQSGKATTYGPNPLYLSGNEPGYQSNAVGVGCANGPNDPNWIQILSNGQYNASSFVGLSPKTVWPKVPTVAVSQFAWPKSIICWKKVVIRNKKNQSKSIEAIIVDFCPTNGCHWNHPDRAWNVDIYGIRSYQALGGSASGGVLDVEISWPAGIQPNTSGSLGLSYQKFISWVPLPSLLLALLL